MSGVATSPMTLAPVATLSGHTEARVWHVAWAPSGATLASCGEDRSIRLWAPATPASGGEEWHCVAVLEEGHQRTIRCIAWSPDGAFIASCSFDGTASVWESLDGDFDCVAQLEGHENEVKAVAWSASGQFLATCGRDKSVFVWETVDENYEVAGVLHAHAADVKAVAWHPQREVLASASYDDTLKLYAQQDDDWRALATLSAHTSTVWALAFSPDGECLASCSDDRSVVLWRDVGGEGASYVPAATLREVHERAIYSISWVAPARGVGGGFGAGSAQLDAGLIATGAADDAIALMRATVPSADSGAPAGTASLAALGRTQDAHSGDVNAIAWRPAAANAGAPPMLASCGDDGCVRLWRVKDA